MDKKSLSDRVPERQYWRSGNMLYPLPAVMVSCMDEEHRPNIITIAWTGTICSDPAMVSISVRPERYSYDLIKNSGEFVINLTTADLAAVTDFCGVRSGRDLDKFSECGLTAIPSKHVSVPAIAECPVNIECRVRQIIPLGSHDLFLADVLGIAVDSQYLDEAGRLCLEKTRPLAYSHGEYYEIGKMIGKFGFSVRKGQKTPRAGQNTNAGRSGKKAFSEVSGKSFRSAKSPKSRNAKRPQKKKFSAGDRKNGESRRKKSTRER